MTVSPIMKRASRPCSEWTDKQSRCVFLSLGEFGASCNLTGWPQTEDDMDEILRPVTCEFHFTQDEMLELITDRNTLERTLGINDMPEDS